MNEPSRERQLETILHAYLQAVDAGNNPDREELLRRYPDFAKDLRDFFADQEKMDGFVKSMHKVQVGDPTIGTDGSTDGPSALPRIRYIGDYELLEVIARGGMGVVYKARQVTLNRVVALKMILAGQLASAGDVERFKTEAEAAGGLDHPNIVPIYEVGEFEGQHYFSMKLVEGGSLANWIADCRMKIADFRKDLQMDIARLTAVVARAVHHAHQRSILHRDLKPANILLQVSEKSAFCDLKSAIPSVTDFGLAKRVEGASGMTQSGAIVGTPGYMAPEQVRAEKQLTTAVDVYGLGAILYELLTGRPPFQAKTPFDTLKDVLERDPVPPRSIQPTIDRDLETICLKCLRKEPAQRYASASELADELERYVRGEPILARPVGSLERTTKWVRRNPVVSAMMTAILLLLVGGSAGIYVKYQDAKEQEGIAKKNEKAALEQEQEAKKQTGVAKENEERANKAVGEKDIALNDLKYNRALDRISLAQAAFDSGNVPLAHERLEEIPSDLRRWEWHYLKRQYNGGIFTLNGHTSTVLSVAFSPDGTRIATGSFDNTAKIWDARTGAPQFDLKGHSKPVSSVAFSPDGTRIATGSSDRTAKVWDARNGTLLLELKGHTNVIYSVAFSADGTRIATGSADKTAKVWDARTCAPLLEIKGQTDEVRRVAFSPNGTRIVTGGGDKTAKVWDASTGTLLYELKGHTEPITSVSFSPDGIRIATGSRDKTAKVWDASTGRLLYELKGHTETITGVAFSPDGIRLATGSMDKTAKVWDARTGTPLLELKGLTEMIYSVAFSPDGTRIATSSWDKTTKVWDARTGTPLLELKGHALHVLSVAFSPDGTRIATSSWDKTTKVWDARTGTPLFELKGHALFVWSVAFSPDGTRLATGSEDKTAKLWDARSGTPLLELKGHAQQVMSVAFSPDGTRLATSSSDRTAKVWDTRSGTPLLELKGHSHNVNCVVFSPDGTRLATGSSDKTAKVWDARTGTPLLELKGHAEGLTSVAFSPDGTRIVTGSYDNMAKVWDARTGAPLLDLKGHSQGLTSVAFSPDGTRIVTGSMDNTAKVWDAHTGTPLLELKGHSQRVTSVAFSADGARLATGSADGTVKVWDANNHARIVVGVLTPEEREYRLFWTRPRPDLHKEEYLKAVQAKDTFAADFHLGRLILTLDPKDAEVAKYLDDKDRTRWRKQALDWLRADLTSYEKQVESGKPADRTMVKQRLTNWQKNADLAGIRDPESLAKLSAEEREACQKLWADVATLLKKVQEKGK